jgi:L-ascorbate metabolism protein UlaG (beta-lactamase superfamily)
MLKKFGIIVICVGALLFGTAYVHFLWTTPEPTEQMKNSPNWKEGKFVNSVKTPMFIGGMNEVWKNIAGGIGLGNERSPALPLPAHPIDAAKWEAAPADAFHCAWLGHSSLLIRVEGTTILVDPVLDERASPLWFVGPKRFHPVPVTVETLPTIDLVIITHDHYDHLEKSTVCALAERVKRLYVPLGIDVLLQKWGIPAEKIVGFDWWNTQSFGPLTIVATPALHYARRGIFDGDLRLWTSWVIRGAAHGLFISGDSGYMDEFKKIGAQYGPFDVAFLKIGSYGPGWTQIHMSPEEAFHQYQDVKARLMVPTHFATFDLAYHPWYEPAERLLTAASGSDAIIVTPEVGVIVDFADPPVTKRWWRSYMGK